MENINTDCNIKHNLWREETQSLNLIKLKELMDQNEEKLLDSINEQNIDVDLSEGLNISETEEDKEVKELSSCRYYDLFRDIQPTSLKKIRI